MADADSMALIEITVLFRFRDLVAKTLEEHQRIIDKHKACWWGWWKRPNEPNREEIWRYLQGELAKHGQVVVGLFDSGAHSNEVAVHRARVTGVIPPLPAGDPRGVPSLPPGEENMVPSYYRESPFRRCAKITSATPSGMIKNACFSRVLSVIAPAPLLKLFLRTALAGLGSRFPKSKSNRCLSSVSTLILPSHLCLVFQWSSYRGL